MQGKHILNFASILSFFGIALYIHVDGKSDERWHPHAVLLFLQEIITRCPSASVKKMGMME